MAGLGTLTAIPSTIRAGDSLVFSISTKHPSTDGWGLLFSGRSGSAAVEFSSNPDGLTGNHLVSIAAAVTATYAPGIYTFQCRATLADGSAITDRIDQIEVLADLSQQEEGYDPRSQAKRNLDNIEAVIAGRASSAVLNSTIAGQSLGRMTPDQLFALKKQFWSDYQQELRAMDAANKKNRAVIGISFVDPI